MKFKHYIDKYQNLKKNGEYEKARQLKLKMEKGARGVISRFTQGKPVLAYPVSWVIRLFETKDSKAELVKVMQSYNYGKDQLKGIKKWRIKNDIYFSEFNYRVNADEYLRYRFENLSDEGRKKYVGSTELIEGFHKVADPEEAKILANKYNAYCYFKQYYNREAILVNDEKDLRAFEAFCAENKQFFIKPLSEYGGQGVQRYTLQINDKLEELLKEFTKDGPVIIEQPIIQAEEMAKFHPQSINTVRIVTAHLKTGIEVVQTSVRLGMGDSVVDNGCLSASVDTEMGIISTPGRVAHGAGLYLRHPDTGEQILGSEIPHWKELLDLVKELANKLERQKVVGWDFAYSVNGWIVVEANSNPSIQILAGAGTGMRSVFERITKN